MSLLDRLKKNTTIKDSSILAKSKFFSQKDMVQTDVPMINVALSGSLDGSITPGLTMLAGPSKHFKSAFGLLMASAYMKKYKDAVVLLDNTNLSTTLTDAALSLTADVAETSTFTASSKTYVAGLKDGTATLSGYFESSSPDADAEYLAQLGGSGAAFSIAPIATEAFPFWKFPFNPSS